MIQLSDITVIVPTKNEERNIVRFLESIPPEVQLIVVDASEDSTRSLVFKTRMMGTTLIHSKAHIAAARHLGAQRASTPWLLFADADVVFSPDYFDQVIHSGECDVLYGTKLSQDRYQNYYRSFQKWQGIFHGMGIPAISGSNVLIKWKAYFSVGGFDLNLTVNEDTEIGFRLKRQGFKINYDPQLIVYATDHRRLDRGTVRKNLHSISRNFLLYFNLLPHRWYGRDWGYWSNIPATEEKKH